MSLEGRTIGNRYEVIGRIGNGGMATVYKAQDTILKRYVAIKVLRDEFTTDEEFIKRFNVEAQSAAALTHPNIVSIYDVGHEDDIYYIVMELIQGKTLKEIIDEDGMLPWKWSLNIAIQIASALEVAHKNNIVHRDIKPHNIIITEDGIAKVTDFGIAKAVSNSTITAFGSTIGSVHYFSPEHARGGFTDAKSDLYSLGIVMYEMLTGRVPFDADTPVSIALKHMQEKPIEPNKINTAIPYSVNKIILKAMEKDGNLRYKSATEMLKDLTMALKNPDGHFVRNISNTNAYTQVMQTIKEEDIKKNTNKEEKGKKNKGKIIKYIKEHPAIKIAIIALLIILIPVIAFFSVQKLMSAGTGKSIILPNFVNMTEEEAKSKAEELELQLEFDEKYDPEIEKGKIAAQEPEYLEGYTIKKATTVKLWVSKGTSLRKVPKVAGEKYEDAETILTEQEFLVEKIEETSDKVEAGYVTRQEPEADTELNAGDTVKVYVSTGVKQITMEYVIGSKEADVKKQLTKIGFEVKIVYEEDTTKESGIVLEQSIEAGSIVDDKTKVIITVNKIEELKEGTVNINLKSLTGGIETDEEGTEIEPTAKVEVKVTSAGSEDTVYSETHRKDIENLSIQVSGKGTITVKVLIDGVTKKTSQLNLNSSSPVLNIN